MKKFNQKNKATNHHAQLEFFGKDDSNTKKSKDNDASGEREQDLRPPGSQEEEGMIIDQPDVKIDGI